MVENSNYLEEEVPVVSEKTDTCYESITDSEYNKLDKIKKGETKDILSKFKDPLTQLSEKNISDLLINGQFWKDLEVAVENGYIKRKDLSKPLKEYIYGARDLYTKCSENCDPLGWDKKIEESESAIKSINNGEDIIINGIILRKTPRNYGS